MALRATAYVTSTAAALTKTSTLHGVRFTWKWNGTPMLAGPAIEDGVAVAWRSSVTSGATVNSELHSGTKLKIKFGTKEIEMPYSTQNISNTAQAKFYMTGNGSGVPDYANSGVFDVYVKTLKNTTTKFNQTIFSFVYGHCSLTVSSVSFGFKTDGVGSIGITVEKGVEETRREYKVQTA